MSFEKQKADYEALKGVEHLDADLELLQKVMPESPWLKRKVINRITHHDAVLWALVKACSREEIENNRNPAIDVEAITAACIDIIAKIAASETKEEAEKLLDQVKESANPLTDDQKAELLQKATEATPDFEVMSKQKEMEEAKATLLSMDLDKAGYKDKIKVFSALDLEKTAKDKKNTTITPMLVAFKSNLQKEVESITEKMEGTKANPDGSENVLNETDPGKKELEEKVEELEDENEDLQEQLEEKELENKELQERIEAEGEISEEKKQQIIADYQKEKSTADPADKTGEEPGTEKKN